MSEPETPVTTESEPEPVDRSVDLTIEHGRVCVIRGVARADIWHRPRDEGPFGAGRECSGVGIARAELLDELIRACQVRTYRVHGMAVGGRRGSWGPLVIGCLPGDLEAMHAALRALFEDDDETLLRAWVGRPPALPPEAVGPRWEPPAPHEGFIG
jgi:hypothetical protein